MVQSEIGASRSAADVLAGGLGKQFLISYIGQFPPRPGLNQYFDVFAIEDAAFICLGLANDARLFDSKESLKAAEKLMNSIALAILLNAEEREEYQYSAIGLTEAAYILHLLTEKQEYLGYARRLKIGPARTTTPASLLDWVVDPPFDGGWGDKPKNPSPGPRKIWHVYRALERMFVQLRINRNYPDDRLTKMPLSIERALFQSVRPGFTIAGGIGASEGWSFDQDHDQNGETCAAAYSLRYSLEMMNLKNDLSYGDALERVATWKGKSDVSQLAGKPVRLRFVMKDADLYSFRFRNQKRDEQ